MLMPDCTLEILNSSLSFCSIVGFHVPLPVAHGLVGASVVAALRPSNQPGRWRWLALGAFLGIAPDFDFALNWLRLSRGGWITASLTQFLLC